jgi:tRNA modification GTPase
MLFDTIVAQATASGIAALNIIRVSGMDAISLVDKIIQGPNLEQMKSHQIVYAHVVDQEEIIDEVMVSVFREPRSFTRENMVEITCHGGLIVSSEIIKLLIRHGARLAEPGEFSKRAFIHGRIDLTMAEGIVDVVEAKTREQLILAQKSISGDIKAKVDAFQSTLLEMIGIIEVNIDYPEYDDVLSMTGTILKPKLESLINDIDAIIRASERGKIVREGLSVVIVGKPNVGKSSLLNSLLKEERAIVTDVSGTTRDLIEAEMNLDGLLVKLIDTAGIRKTEDVVETIGVNRAKKAIDTADLVLLVVDQSDSLTDLDSDLLELTKTKKRILVGNKIDLGRKHDFAPEHVVDISAKNKIGLDDLAQKIREMFLESSTTSSDLLFANERHVGIIQQARDQIGDALDAIHAHMPIDLIVIDLHGAWESLGEITGKSTTETLIDHLFASFCLGK